MFPERRHDQRKSRRHHPSSGGLYNTACPVVTARLFCAISVLVCSVGLSTATAAVAESIALPVPRTDSTTSLEAALAQRRSVRSYSEAALRIGDLAQLLWSAQGVTSPRGYRTAPSAGALYPLEVYVVAGNVQGLAPAVYKYAPGEHTLTKWREGDFRRELAGAAWRQSAVRDAPAVVVFAGVVKRTARKYGGRAERYVLLEVGHAAQNVFLQVQTLGLGAVVIGAFRDRAVARVLTLPDEEKCFYLMPVGVPLSGGS